MRSKILILLALVLTGSPLMAEGEDRMLFSFDNIETAKQWLARSDRVMGGRSDGRFRINNEKKMDFVGTLSLENSGGFAAVRSRGVKLGLASGDSIVLLVRGDGREYIVSLYAPTQLTGFSYRAEFKTKQDEWIEVSLPLDKFVAKSHGRVVHDQPLEPGEVNGIGILLADKQPGPFKLEVEWIKVRPETTSASPITHGIISH